jgi:hypothetical protein
VRAFIRFSLDNDNGTLSVYMRQLLEDKGFRRIGTSAYEHTGITIVDLAEAMQEFWAAVENPTAAFPNATILPDVKVDHIWIYTGSM